MNEEDLAVPVFSITLVVVVLFLSIFIIHNLDEKRNFEEVFSFAQEQDSMRLCDGVFGRGEAIECFAYFIRNGSENCYGFEKEVHCLTALGIVKKDEDICHLPLMKKQLEFKNLCMAEIQVEKYER